MSKPVLTTPYTEKEQRRIATESNSNRISGVIKVQLTELVDLDEEAILDLISERLVGHVCLGDFTYHVVGHEGDTLHLEVEGENDRTFDEDDEESQG